VRFLVTSAGSANGGGHDAVLNSADRMLALDRGGRVVRDSGPMADLDPGGAVFGPDGRFYVTMRRRRTVLGISATLDGDAEPLLPEGIVPFPRGFGFARDGSLYLASGIGPSGEGDNTILAFDPVAPAQPRRLVTDPELSPLDLIVVPNGHIVVASESPFRAPDAVVTIREYDPASGDLVRVFVPSRSVNFRQPRGCDWGQTATSIASARLTRSRSTSRLEPSWGRSSDCRDSTAKRSCCSARRTAPPGLELI
jgi:hypothetical protein